MSQPQPPGWPFTPPADWDASVDPGTSNWPPPTGRPVGPAPAPPDWAPSWPSYEAGYPMPAVQPWPYPPLPPTGPTSYQPVRGKRPAARAGLVLVLVTALIAAVVGWQVLGAAETATWRSEPVRRSPIVRAPVGPVQTFSTPVTAAMSAGVVLISGELDDGIASGTGIVLSSSGLVLTNYHVVSDTVDLQVHVAKDANTYRATVLGRNVWSDIAVLQLQAASGLTVATLDDDGLQVGDRVVAVGNSHGEGRLVASGGSVTQLDSSVLLPSAFGGYGADRLSGLIQSTAGAVPGYSGGPTFDHENEVVGVTSAGRDQAAEYMTSYSIPIDTAMAIANDIIGGRQNGQTRLGPGPWLGVTLGSEDVPLVMSVIPGSPAEAVGLTPGATITSYNNVQLSTANALLKVLESSGPGERVLLGWVDEAGQTHEGFITLGTSSTN